MRISGSGCGGVPNHSRQASHRRHRRHPSSAAVGAVVGGSCLLCSPLIEPEPHDPNGKAPTDHTPFRSNTGIDRRRTRHGCCYGPRLPISQSHPEYPSIHTMAAAGAVADVEAAVQPPEQEQEQHLTHEATALLAAYLDTPLPYTQDDWERVRCEGCLSNKRCVAWAGVRASTTHHLLNPSTTQCTHPLQLLLLHLPPRRRRAAQRRGPAAFLPRAHRPGAGRLPQEEHGRAGRDAGAGVHRHPRLPQGDPPGLGPAAEPRGVPLGGRRDARRNRPAGAGGCGALRPPRLALEQHDAGAFGGFRGRRWLDED